MPMTEYTDSGTAVADQDDATIVESARADTPTAQIHDGEISEIAAVALEDIVASPFNPRLARNSDADDELADSVREAAALVPRTAFDLQLIARVTWQGVDYHAKQLLASVLGFKTSDELGKRIGQMDVDELGRFCLDCALIDGVKVESYRIKDQPENLLQAAKHYGVQVDGQASKDDAVTTPEDALAAAVGDGEGSEA